MISALRLTLIYFCAFYFGIVAGVPLFAATQATFYVAPAGNDSGPGTLAEPFQTITAAQSAVRAINENMSGDIIVYLRGGTYNLSSALSFTPADSGSNGFHIIYEAYDHEIPVISGGTQVTGWNLVDGSSTIYSAHLDRSTKLRSLFVNGVRAQMTQKNYLMTGHGNLATYTVPANASWATTTGSEPDDIQFSSTDVGVYANPDDVEIVQNNGFNSIIASARGMCTSNQSSTVGGASCVEPNSGYTDVQLSEPYGAIAGSLLYGTALNPTSTSLIVRNAYELLNSPGMFYFNKATQTLFYYSRGEDMATANVIAPVTEGSMTIHGASTSSRVVNLQFIGITFSFDQWQLYNVAGSTGMAALQSVAGQVLYAGANGWHADIYNDTQTAQASIDVQNANSVLFQNDSFEHLSSGIAISLTNDVINSSIVGNGFVDLSGNAINIGNGQNAYDPATTTHPPSRLYPAGIWGVCTDDLVKDNYVRSPNQDFYQFEGISAAYVNGLQLLHNDISKPGYTGINLGWGWVNTPDSTTAQNNSVEYNRIDSTNQILNGDGGALYTLGQQPNTTVSYNYVTNSPDTLYPDQGSQYISFDDNVLANPGYWLYLWNATAMPNLLFDNNYVSTNNYENAASNTPSSNDVIENTVVENPWQSDATAIINGAGLESQYNYLSIPTSVTGLSATSSSSQVNLSWQATGIATSFNIYRSTASGAEGSIPYQSGISAGTFTDTDIVPGITYYYKVSAMSPTGESAQSTEASTTPFTSPTSVIYKVVVQASGSNMVLDANGSTTDGTAIVQNPDNSINDTFQQWHIVSLGSGYFKLLNVGSGKCLDQGGVQTSGNAVIQWDDQATSNTNQQWQVQGQGSDLYFLVSHTSSQYLSDGNPSGSNNQNAGNPMTQWPTTANAAFQIVPVSAVPPIQVIATSGSSKATLSWSPNGSATSFNLYRGTRSGGEGSTPYEAGVTGSSFTDSSVANGTTYYYILTAVNQFGESLPSPEVSAAPFGSSVAYTIVSNISGMVLDNNGLTSDGTGMVQEPDDSATDSNQRWNFIDVGSGYYALINVGDAKALDNGGVQTIGSQVIQWDNQASTNTNQQWLVLSQGNGNYYLVDRTSNQYLSDGIPFGSNNLAPGNAIVEYPTAPNATWQIVPSSLATPTNVVASAGSTQAGLSWNSNATSFNIYRGTIPGGEDAIPYASGISGTTFTDASVTDDTTYYYKIAAIVSGQQSALSSEVSATPLSTTTLYKVISVSSESNMVLDTNGSTQDGTAVVQNPDNSSTDTFQQWKIVSLGSGYFKLLNVGSGKCLDNGGVQVSGNDLIQWDDQATSNTNQQWNILSQGLGTYYFINHTSGQYLSDGSPTGTGYQSAGNPMTQWSTVANAQFQIVPIN